jgi:hypothetical protein
VNDDEDDEPIDRSSWMICPECRGDGKHSKHLGAITEEDRERDWDPDMWDDYLAGHYDQICDACRGAGKLREKAWENYSERQSEYRSENFGQGRYGL